MFLAHFLLFIQLKPQVQRMVLSEIKMGLPMSVKVTKMILYRHAQRSTCELIIYSVKLTLTITHRNHNLPREVWTLANSPASHFFQEA